MGGGSEATGPEDRMWVDALGRSMEVWGPGRLHAHSWTLDSGSVRAEEEAGKEGPNFLIYLPL